MSAVAKLVRPELVLEYVVTEASPNEERTCLLDGLILLEYDTRLVRVEVITVDEHMLPREHLINCGLFNLVSCRDLFFVNLLD